MFSKGKVLVDRELLDSISEFDILSFYTGINKVPSLINSPFRKDNNPSFGIYSPDGKRIFYKDFATGDRGGLFDLLSNLWGTDFNSTLGRILKEFSVPSVKESCVTHSKSFDTKRNGSTDLQCKIRKWENHDLEYWGSYGITVKWLEYSEVYPISHKIILKNGNRYVFKADKYAYVYVERKEGNITLKIYQPFNRNGYKWSNKHDSSVISLWTKVPECGKRICICSSLKDALCLWANTGIPSIALQGEGYVMSNTAIRSLRERYNEIYILFDNDPVGIKDGIKLSKYTGFTNLVLPPFDGGKDISDYMKLFGKSKFLEMTGSLFSILHSDYKP